MTLSTAHDAEGGHFVFPRASEGQGAALQRHRGAGHLENRDRRWYASS
jgi:hypothetical protein